MKHTFVSIYLTLVICGFLFACSTSSENSDVQQEEDFMDWRSEPPPDEMNWDVIHQDNAETAVPDVAQDVALDVVPDLPPDENNPDTDGVCVADCSGKQCGEDGCGGSCGSCTGAQEACVANQCVCTPACEGFECGDDGCGGACGMCKVNEMCTVEHKCWCVPNCVDRQCGDDGCGGTCGNCLGVQDACVEGRCVCQPACQGKECGDDGCGAFCGSCDANPNALCIEGQCVCYPNCAGKECGPDGCGTFCGECFGNQEECVGGQCECQPACEGKECGIDGCGGYCGQCLASDEVCSNGICLTECLHNCDEVLVSAGTTWIGCNEFLDILCDEAEKPYHAVYLDAYYIDRTEVTVAAYTECVSAGACSAPDTADLACNWAKAGKEAHPVNCVSWQQALDFCQWAGKRLPTEAEWEKAARGTDGRLYPWGNQTATCDYAVMYQGGFGCGFSATFPVCTKAPAGNTTLGGCDMAGNVWEWTADWFHANYYSTSPSSNPKGPDSGTTRVQRGGGYRAVAKYLRTSARIESAPSAFSIDVGFRCARTF